MTAIEKRGNPREIWDYVDLLFLRLAKMGRAKLEAGVSQEQFYEEFFNENDVQMFDSGGDLRRRYRAEVLRPAAWAHMPTGAKVIDVGCGTGDNLRYILRQDARFSGIEYAKETAAAAGRVLGTAADIRVGSATSMPYQTGEFDLALCIEVLEHMEEDERATEEIARIVRPGGHLILSLPYRAWFRSYYPLMGHFRHYTRTDVVAMLDRHGFSVVEFLPNYPTWSRFANYCYITCRLYTAVLRVLGIRRTPVDVKVPFSMRKLIDELFSWLEPLRGRESRAEYRAMETSTFVVARRA